MNQADKASKVNKSNQALKRSLFFLGALWNLSLAVLLANPLANSTAKSAPEASPVAEVINNDECDQPAYLSQYDGQIRLIHLIHQTLQNPVSGKGTVEPRHLTSQVSPGKTFSMSAEVYENKLFTTGSDVHIFTDTRNQQDIRYVAEAKEAPSKENLCQR